MTNRLLIVALSLSMPGCVLLSSTRGPRLPPPGDIVQARAEVPVSAVGRPFEGAVELSEAAIVEQVLARNPTLVQMTAAWKAAMQRLPQVTSWDDPMLTSTIAPASFGSNVVDAGYRIELAQKLLYAGKRHWRGQNATAEASASHNDLEDMRIQLIEAARLAYYEYYLADRSIAVNEEALKLLTEIRQNAYNRFTQGQAQQQDVFQADVDIGRQKERQVLLSRMKKVAQARINILMHIPSTAPLPPPAQGKPVPLRLPEVEQLQAQAIAQRADLKALADRIHAEEAALALAEREYYPDLELAGAYDSIMGNGPARQLAPQIGLKMNLPVRLARRDAAVQEARFKIAQKQAELVSRTDQVHLQVQEAYEQYRESEKVLKLYDETILPAARANRDAAQSAYINNKVPFVSLIEAQRNYVQLRERYYEATADFLRRRANLERAVSGSIAPRE